jgi:hypothetical protein
MTMKKNDLYPSGHQPNWPTNFISELDSSRPAYNGAHSPRWVEAPGAQQKAQTKTQSTGKKRNKIGAQFAGFGNVEMRRTNKKKATAVP